MDKNLAFFEAHLADLIKDHYGKYVIISDEKVAAVVDSFDEAYIHAIKDLKLKEGDFIIQHCVDPITETNYFAGNNIAFA
jgi:hypothetical protein